MPQMGEVLFMKPWAQGSGWEGAVSVFPHGSQPNQRCCTTCYLSFCSPQHLQVLQLSLGLVEVKLSKHKNRGVPSVNRMSFPRWLLIDKFWPICFCFQIFWMVSKEVCFPVKLNKARQCCAWFLLPCIIASTDCIRFLVLSHSSFKVPNLLSWSLLTHFLSCVFVFNQTTIEILLTPFCFLIATFGEVPRFSNSWQACCVVEYIVLHLAMWNYQMWLMGTNWALCSL